MQLENTLFGLLLVPIKPQLEKVLNLPRGSLTKEIKLTQDAIKLLIEYSIPTTILAAEDKECDAREKVETVQGYASAIYSMLEEEKRKTAEDLRQENIQRNAEEIHRGAAHQNEQNHLCFGPASVEGQTESDKKIYDLNCFYELLGVDEQATDKQIKKAFIKLAQKYHPDRGGDSHKWLKIQRAYDVLRDPDKRKEYMRFGDEMSTEGDDDFFGTFFGGGRKRGGGQSGGDRGASTAASMGDPFDGLFGGGGRCGEGPHDGNGEDKELAAGIRDTGNPFHEFFGEGGRHGRAANGNWDYMQVPFEIDRRFEGSGYDSVLRPTLISTSSQWTKTEYDCLLAGSRSKILALEDQRSEKEKAFDLLDALTLSGTVAVECATLHIVAAVTHCFNETLTKVVVQRNLNPIEEVERSSLVVASTIHERPAEELIRQCSNDSAKT
eukprot:gnl/MRDRNA2_/MRDRNA2_153063_c0_seq1.p1 gnl/MRDRNA2_/MRDRNA2_153063_c0~~gnl/MRDRNA2_/MRDRNA2_153063_c0_seq1.p1  ORF type:complete len:438 (-),score=107.83 gnl/MRDRNA2_/MRDRNA2_153063_c0_seq1:22-1335(-)